MPSRRERKLTILIVGALTTLRHLGRMVGQSHAKSVSKSVSKSASKSVSTSASKSTSLERGAVRFRFLDGLRGWAAVVVLLHHLFVDGLPANSFMADRALWAKVFFLNGALAVSVFFVISGFSLSIRYLETGDARALARIASGRYLRLALPIFAICVVTYALLVSGLIPPAAQRPSPLDQFLSFSPTIDGLLSFSLLKVFVAYSGAESFDPPLWTMTYEFFGSFMVFALIAYLRPSRLRTLLLAMLFLLLTALQTYFALFVAGILIADLFALIGASTAANRAGAALCGAGLYGASSRTACRASSAGYRSRFIWCKRRRSMHWRRVGSTFWRPTASPRRRSDGCSTSRSSPSRSSARSRFARSTILRWPRRAVSAQASSRLAMSLAGAGHGAASRAAPAFRLVHKSRRHRAKARRTAAADGLARLSLTAHRFFSGITLEAHKLTFAS
jgi:Acyltransferase family